MANDLSSAALDKILHDSVHAAKKQQKKDRKQDLKFAKESLGRSLLRIMELMKERE